MALSNLNQLLGAPCYGVMWVCACSFTSVMSDSLWSHGLWPTRLLYPWNSLGKNTGVNCHFLLQGIFLTQGSNSNFLHLPALKHGFFTISATWEPVSYALLNRRFEKLSGNVESRNKLRFHLITSYFLMLSDPIFKILVWPEITSYWTPKRKISKSLLIEGRLVQEG